MMGEAIEQSGDACGVRKDLIPFFKIPIRGDNHRASFVAAIDDFVEKIGGIIVIGKVGEFVDAQQMRPRIGLDSSSSQLGRIALQMFDDIRGRAKQDGVPGHDGRMSDVFGDHRFPEPIATKHDEIAALLDKIQCESALDNVAIYFLRPVPIEVGHRFEVSNAGESQTILQTQAGAFLAFHSMNFFKKHARRPAGFGGASNKIIEIRRDRLQADLR